MNLHCAPKGNLQVNSGSGLINLDQWTNHAHNTNERAETVERTDTHVNQTQGIWPDNLLLVITHLIYSIEFGQLMVKLS